MGNGVGFNSHQYHQIPMKYKVEKIISEHADPADYPGARTDPVMSEYVDDEFELFIVSENGGIWRASEFFYMNDIKHIQEFEA